MTPDQIQNILTSHAMWRDGDTNGKRADLCDADLFGADLSNAVLFGANLSNATVSEPVCRVDFGGWSVCVREEFTTIGCRKHANTDWLKWSPEDVKSMHPKAEKWWQTHGEAIKSCIRCVMEKAAECEGNNA